MRTVKVYKTFFRGRLLHEHHSRLWNTALLVNGCGVVLIIVAWMEDWIANLFFVDTWYVLRAILVLFFFGWVCCMQRIAQINEELDAAKEWRDDDDADPDSIVSGYLQKIRGTLPEERIDAQGALEEKLHAKTDFIAHIVNLLTMLGLLGTLVGIYIAFVGFAQNAGAESEAVMGSVANGIAVSILASIFGIVGYVWLSSLYELLKARIRLLLAAILELGVKGGSHEKA